MPKTLYQVTQAKLIAVTENNKEILEEIAEAVGTNINTLYRIRRGITDKPDCNLIQRLYEYLFECELDFT